MTAPTATIPDQLDVEDAPDDAPYDPLAALTVNELAVGSRHLKASLVASITGQSADYERALAVVLWLHARRADPTAQLGVYMRLTFSQLTDELGQLQPDPTTPTPSPS